MSTTAELRDDGRIDVSATFAQKDLVKLVPGARWDPNTKGWHVPLSWASCKVLRAVFGDQLQLGESLNAWAWNERTTRIEPAMAMRQVVDYEHGNQRLMPHQRADVTWWYYARQALLGNDPGCGKTASAINGVRTFDVAGLNPWPVCVIVPNTIKLNWVAEWGLWDPNFDPLHPNVRLIPITGSATDKRKLFAEAKASVEAGVPTVVIINWEAVRLHSRVAPYGNIRLSEKDKTPGELNEIQWRTVIVDEAHRMKDAHSKQTRAVWAVQHMPSVEFRLSMTGTPIANHMGDLWAPMHGVAPHEYPGKTAYVDRYALQSYTAFGALEILGVRPDTRDEFYSIFDPRFRRMTKAVVLPFLPPKVRPVFHCEMAPKQRKAYNDIDQEMVTRLDDGSVIMSTNNLARNTRLLQFASAYATINEEGNVRLSEPSPKLDAMMEIIEDRDPEQLVIAAESRQLIELAAARLEKAGISHRLIVGGMTMEQRQWAIDDFQAGRARVVLMTLKAGGVGITLTAASAIVFLQRSWSMIDNVQGEDRVHRIGSEQHEKIEVIELITQGTIEETLIPRMLQKLNRLEEITRDRALLEAQGNTAALNQLEQEQAALMATPLWAREGDLSALIDDDGTDMEVA